MDQCRVHSHSFGEFLTSGLSVVGDVDEERADIQFDIAEPRTGLFANDCDLVGDCLRRHVGDDFRSDGARGKRRIDADDVGFACRNAEHALTTGADQYRRARPLQRLW